MKTCPRLARIRSDFEKDIRFLTAYAERNVGTAPAKTSAKHAITVRQNMARAMSRHFARCPECG
ncbi:hypothetical protein [Streptomyces scabiei]|uniref:hypothetical protein n=1 Tax=Streptomyces scabiei TaxID=1930 RepID=UPI0029B953FD|nr:hypothetical protein [Streptomyces scabiei]MDX3523327.1 hypothetical protein [Streptomyces scabiei]